MATSLEMKFGMVCQCVLTDALSDERLDGARWKLDKPQYVSILAGAYIDHAVMLIRGLTDHEGMSEEAFLIMLGCLRKRLDMTAMLSIQETKENLT